MSGTLSTDVDIGAVVDGNSTTTINSNIMALSLRKLFSAAVQSTAIESGIQVNYTYAVNKAISAPNDTDQQAFDKASNELSTNAINGNFTKYLNQYAISNSASVQMKTASSSSVTISSSYGYPTAMPTSSPKSNDSLTIGDIVGIVIGSITVIAIVAAVIFFCCSTWCIAKTSLTNNRMDASNKNNIAEINDNVVQNPVYFAPEMPVADPIR